MKALDTRFVVRWMVNFFRNRYVLFVLFFCPFSQLFFFLIRHQSSVWVSFGKLLFSGQYLELPLLLYLFWYLNVLVKPSRFQALIAATPLLFCYLLLDISFLLLGRMARLSDLGEVPELISIMPLSYMILPGGIIIAYLLFLVFSLSVKRWKAIILGVLPVATLVIAVGIFPQSFINVFHLLKREANDWSDVQAASTNGRFVMLCYHEAERRLTLEKTDSFYNRNAYDKDALELANWLKENGNHRNIHLVIMESYVDPTLFNAASYSQSPVHPEYEKMFAGRMGYSLSPVFGGRTAQAEFEALCGVPAYEEMGSVEFNLFSGSEAWCLPGILRRSGYQSIASIASRPDMFNAVKAYKGAGFSEQHYPQEYSPASTSYLSTGDVKSEMFMFDGDLFAQNREFIRQILAKKDHPPLFNYVLTLYGHVPYRLDKKKRPEFIRLTSKYRDDNLERVANQFWYRSQAVAEHVRELTKTDPDSLIVIVSDHLPALAGILTYHELRYLDNSQDNLHMNRILIIDRGKVRQYETIHHYNIPRLILDALTGDTFSGEQHGAFADLGRGLDVTERQNELHRRYMRLMAHAIK